MGSSTQCFSCPSTRFVNIDPMTLYIIHYVHVDSVIQSTDSYTRVTFLPDSSSERDFVCLSQEATTFCYGSKVESRFPRAFSVLS